jgi:NAD-dependent deacetylase
LKVVNGGAGDALVAAVRAARRVVVFTGAGISQESGLGTFRGVDGLWEKFRPEELATPEAFARNPELVSRWYAERFATMRAARPNAGHLAIARWEDLFPSLVVVTQNIDRLHQRAGSRRVLELHGTIWLSRCARCGREVATDELPPADPPPPRCACGGLFRPGVVWFGEPLPEAVFSEAAQESAEADLFVVVGTSGTVWPAAGLVELAARAGAAIVEVNREETPLSSLAEKSLRGAAGEVLPRLTEEWRAWRSPS